VVCSRDHKGVGVAHEIKPTKNQPQFSQMTMGAVLVRCKTKPKKAFRSTQNSSKKLLWNFKKNWNLKEYMEFSSD